MLTALNHVIIAALRDLTRLLTDQHVAGIQGRIQGVLLRPCQVPSFKNPPPVSGELVSSRSLRSA
jgi:hypothetical protein